MKMSQKFHSTSRRCFRYKHLTGVLGGILLSLLVVGIAYALPTFATIDGNPSDWTNPSAPATCAADPGGVDDEASPGRADITEFCVYLDSGYLYLMMAWDDTRFQQDSTAGTRVDVTGDGLYDFIILATQTKGTSLAPEYSIGSCVAGVCNNADDVCSSTNTARPPCTGAAAARGMTWVDPFTHTTDNCDGTNCTTQDGFVELAIPWALLGYAAPPNPQTFGNYGSYPSGPGQGIKDDTGANGLACRPDGTCYYSTPTAVELIELKASSQPQMIVPLAILAVAVLAGGGLLLITRRQKRINR